MTEPEKPGTDSTAKPAPEQPGTQTLPNDFFAKLLHLPSCKTKGYCDNCGRCER